MKTTVMLLAILSMLPIANISNSQLPSAKPLHSPASVEGFIGGESHDSYVVHVCKGQVLTVRLAWLREGENQAEFNVTASPNSDSEAVKFGKWSGANKRWSGKVPKTADYYIQVVAHPTAHYTLRVTVR